MRSFVLARIQRDNVTDDLLVPIDSEASRMLQGAEALPLATGYSATAINAPAVEALFPTPPEALPDDATTDEDSPIAIDVLENDTEPNGRPLSVEAVSEAVNGSVTVGEDGVVTYTPDLNFSGIDSFTYTVVNDQDETDAGTITITINPLSDAPVAVDDAARLDEDAGPVGIGVRANDTDAEGDPLAIAGVPEPENGTAVVSDGAIAYAPDTNLFGTEIFTYTISNESEAENDAARGDGDGSIVIDALADDIDADGDDLAIVQVGAPMNGAAVADGAGGIRYTPDPDFNGTDSFSYTVADGTGRSDMATVTMTVSAIPEAPAAGGEAATVAEDRSVTIDVRANDADADGDTLTIGAIGDPANGSASLQDGRVVYVPDSNFNGTEELIYTVSDGRGGEEFGRVTVTVTPVNDAPDAEDDALRVLRIAGERRRLGDGGGPSPLRAEPKLHRDGPLPRRHRRRGGRRNDFGGHGKPGRALAQGPKEGGAVRTTPPGDVDCDRLRDGRYPVDDADPDRSRLPLRRGRAEAAREGPARRRARDPRQARAKKPKHDVDGLGRRRERS